MRKQWLPPIAVSLVSLALLSGFGVGLFPSQSGLATGPPRPARSSSSSQLADRSVESIHVAGQSSTGRGQVMDLRR